MDKPYNLLFTADVHGNSYQYFSALLRAAELGLNAVVFGGDIAPKEGNEKDGAHWTFSHRTRLPKAQRDYYENFMIPLFEKFTKFTGIDIYTMMSNDDFGANMDVLEKADEEGKLKLLHERVHELPNDLFIVGESYIDMTPFINKDWEKWDLTDVAQMLGIKEFRNRLDGYSSTKDGFAQYNTPQYHTPQGEFFEIDFRTIPRTDSLETRLNEKIKPLSDPQKTIYVFHASPYDTNLDQIEGHEHVGSQAVRKYFKQFGGLLGLHGHIHETVDISGNYQDKVGGTIVAAAGNDPFNHPTKNYSNYNKNLQALVVEIIGNDIQVRRDTTNFDEVVSIGNLKELLKNISPNGSS